MSDILARLRAPMNRDEFFKVANGLCLEAASEIERLTEAYEDMKADYLRRHNDACDRFLEIERLTRELAEAREAMANDYVLKSEAWDGCQKSAQRARDKALEEAAKVAEKSGRAEDIQLGNENAIAAAIRALKEKP